MTRNVAPTEEVVAPGHSAVAGASMGALTFWAAAVFAVTLGFSRLSYGLLLPALRAEFGGEIASYGIIGTVNFVGYLLGTMLVPPLLGRWHNRAQLNLWSCVLLGLSMIGSALSWSLFSLSAWRFWVGLISAPATVLTIALALEQVRPQRRGLAAGIVWGGGALGIAVSGLLAPVVLSGPPDGWRWVWAGMGLVGVLAGLGFAWELGRGARGSTNVARALPAAPAAHNEGVLAAVLHPKQLLWLTLSYTCFGGGYIIYFTYLIAALIEEGVPAPLAGLVWSAIGVTGAVSGLLWGRAVDRWPRGWTLATAQGLGALGALGILSTQLWLIGAGAALVGLAAFIGPPLIVTALLRRAVSAAGYATAFSVVTALFAGGQIAGPLLGGWAASEFGLAIGAALSAALLAVGALLAVCYALVQRQQAGHS